MTQNVAENKCAKIADMREIPDRRTADIEFDGIAFERRKFF